MRVSRNFWPVTNEAAETQKMNSLKSNKFRSMRFDLLKIINILPSYIDSLNPEH